jgi:outer membrane protein assembly factor BamB
MLADAHPFCRKGNVKLMKSGIPDPFLLRSDSGIGSALVSVPRGGVARGNRPKWATVFRLFLVAWSALLLVVLASAWSPVHADPPTIAATDPGFNNGRALQLSGARVVFSSPTLADLDGDRKLEIVVGGSDGIVYAIGPTGKLLWSYQVAQAIDPLVSTRRPPHW